MSLAEGWLTIAMERFSDILLIKDISRRSGCQIQVIAAEGDNIRQTRGALFQAQDAETWEPNEDTSLELDKILGHLHVEELTVVAHQHDDNGDTAAMAATDSPIINLVNCIFQNAVESGASDIHIEPDDDDFRVR